jgi:hypothetical protein
MKIWEYDLRLYKLLKRCLTSDCVSPAADHLDGRMRTGLLESIRTAELGARCRCGAPCCHTFFTMLEEPRDERSFTVRFLVHDELRVRCDARGRLFHVTWLIDEEKQATKAYVNEGEAGWRVVKLTP